MLDLFIVELELYSIVIKDDVSNGLYSIQVLKKAVEVAGIAYVV